MDTTLGNSDCNDTLDLRNMGVYGPNRHSALAQLDMWILKDAVNALMTLH